MRRATRPSGSTRRLYSLSLLLLLGPITTPATALAPLEGPAGAAPNAPWIFAGLPGQSIPATHFTLAHVEGRFALRIETAGSYGNLIHPLGNVNAGVLSWRWRVDQALTASNLSTREGDDAALKVCALFDLPRAAVPFLERQLLRLAEARTGTPLPNATVCYVWDAAWPANTVIPNAYSRRVRYVTLGSAPGTWQSVRRDLSADFLRAFGEESTSVPRLLAVAVGADADNTGGRSLGYITDLELTPGASR